MGFKMDLPVILKVIKTEKALNKFYDKMRTTERSPFPEDGCANTQYWLSPAGNHIELVVFGKISKKLINEVIVHEAVHVKQHIMSYIEEREPSAEFEAYLVQAVYKEILLQYNK